MKNCQSQRGIAPLIILLIIGIMAAGGGGVYVARKNIIKRAEKVAMEKKAMDEAAMKEDQSRRAEKMVVELHAQNNSGETGSATIENSEGRVKVILRVQNTPASVAQPAHIHAGSCAELGAVAYPLTDVIDGVSETTLSVSVGQLVSAIVQGGLAMNVHKSGPEIVTYVACGDLQLPVPGSDTEKGVLVSPKIKPVLGDEPGTARRDVVPSVSGTIKANAEADTDTSLGTDMADLDAAIKTEDTIMVDAEGVMLKFSGEVLAGFAAPLLDFEKADYDMAVKSGKLVVLYFYANWCPICRLEFPKMEAAFDELKTNAVVGFRVNYNDSNMDVDQKALASQFGVAYQHTKVFVRSGERILKSPEGWNKERYLSEINASL